MGLVTELKSQYKTLSIVGMAKNAGKTTALNYFIEEAMEEDVCLGITSTGRDGESTDVVTGTDKPRVYLDVGTIVSVPTQLYDLADAGLEILRMTKYHTSIGQVLLCRVRESGYVQIAGPVITADHKSMCAEMFAFGAEMVLIDGAIDRKSIAAPETSDAIILSTGAVLSRNIKRVVEETAHIVGIYSLPRLADESAKKAIFEGNPGKIMTVSGGKVCELDLLTGLAASKFIDEAIDTKTEYVYLPGALTNSVIADIHPKKLQNVTLVLKDPTKIFIDAAGWQILRKKGFRVNVLENIKVAAVTVNPVAPGGYSFEHRTLLLAMQEALPDMKVIDVRI